MKLNNELTVAMRIDLEIGQVPLLITPNIADTTVFMETFAKGLNAPLTVIEGGEITQASQLHGNHLAVGPDGKSVISTFQPHASIKQAVALAREVPETTQILLINLPHNITHKLASAALLWAISRQFGESNLPPNLRVVIATNGDEIATGAPEGTLTRLAIHQITLEA